MAASASPVEEPTSVVALDVGGDQPAPHRIVSLGDGNRNGEFVGRSCVVRCVLQKESWAHAVESTASRGQLHALLRRAPRGTTGNQLRAWLLVAST